MDTMHNEEKALGILTFVSRLQSSLNYRVAPVGVAEFERSENLLSLIAVIGKGKHEMC